MQERWTLSDRDAAPGRAAEVDRFCGLSFAPENRLVTVAGTTLLVNPETGNWLRLSSRGSDLVRSLQSGSGWRLSSGTGTDGLPPQQIDAFAETLVRGRFACRGLPWNPTTAGTPAPSSRSVDPFANVMLNATYRCNLRCQHCAVYARPGMDTARSHIAVASRPVCDAPDDPERAAAPFDGSTGGILELIDRLEERGTKTLVLFGGEPLMRRDIRQILSYAAERIPRVCVSTNGTLLSKDLCRLMSERVKEVCISLDGSCAEIHDSMRGAGSFARTLGGIRRLLSYGHKGIVIKTVITQVNACDVPNLVRLAKKLRVRLDLADFAPLGRGKVNRNRFQVPDELLLRTHQRVWLMAEYYELPSASFNVFCRRFMGRAAMSCGAGCGYVLVDCSGEVFPCEGLQYWPLRMGNLLKTDGRHTRASGEVFDTSVDRLPGCAKCELRYFCKGGCAAEVYVSGRRPALCGLYRKVLPSIVSRYRPDASSWQNLQYVFGDALDFSMVEQYLRSGAVPWS